MQAEIRRHELKYYINRLEAAILESRLSNLIDADPNSGPDGTYSIRSLYFDDFLDSALSDNLAGVDFRSKYRMRTYNLDFANVKFEKKSKADGLTGKQTTIIGRKAAESIIAGDIGWMEEAKNPLLMGFSLANRTRMMSPKVVVDYKRRAFIADAGETRITIDSRIRASVAGKDFFDPDLATAYLLEDGISVLEVKFDAFLPEYISRAVQLGTRQRQSASKFAIGRMYGSYSNI